jgi:hypothetical protein
LTFDSVDEFYRKFYFRPRKMFSLAGEMLRSPDVMKRRLREGVEFFRFLRNRVRTRRGPSEAATSSGKRGPLDRGVSGPQRVGLDK